MNGTAPDTPTDPPAGAPQAPPAPPIRRLHALYPNRYAWFILFSALDIMLTHTILQKFGMHGGRELNTIADWVISRYGLWGAIALKFTSVVVVLAVCETVGRRRPALGSRFISIVVFLSTLPTAWALYLLARFAFDSAPA